MLGLLVWKRSDILLVCAAVRDCAEMDWMVIDGEEEKDERNEKKKQ